MSHRKGLLNSISGPLPRGGGPEKGFISPAVEADASIPSSRTLTAHFRDTSWIFNGSDTQLSNREKSSDRKVQSFLILPSPGNTAFI